MKKQVIAGAALVAAMFTTLAAPAWSQATPSPVDLGQLAGTWQVVGVQVSGGPVQALVTDDPTYMGRRLTISPVRIAWASKGGARGESCDTPAVQELGGNLGDALGDAPPKDMSAAMRAAPAYAVACREKDWGPTGGAILARPQEGQLVLTWYDNAVLVLQPVAAVR